MRWRGVNLDMAILSINRSVYRAKGAQSIYQEPKTAKGRRLVDLPPESVLVLRALRERQEADGLLQGYTVNEDTLVFRYRDGSPILPRGLSGAFTKIMRRAGLEGYRLHDARHSHASLMLQLGESPKTIQERLGHARATITLDIYSHLAPGIQKAAALRFNEALQAARGTEPTPRELVQ